MQRLIFILGLPRSGTTLLQRILSTSKDIATAPETWLLLHFLSFREQGHVRSIFNSRESVLGINEFLGNDVAFERELAAAIRRYLQGRYPEHRYFCEKTPRNLLYAEKLRSWFPDDRFLIINRNPLNVAASIFRTFESGILNPYKFRVDLELGIHNLVEQNRKPNGAHILKYEDLTERPESVLHACSEFLDLSEPLVPGRELPMLPGVMGDPTRQSSTSDIQSQPETAYLGFINSRYRKRWFLRYLESIGQEAFTILGYDYNRHREAILARPVVNPISTRDFSYLVGRRFLEFIANHILTRRPNERTPYGVF